MKMMHFFFKNRKKVVNPEKCTRYIEIHLLIFSGHYFHHIGIRLPCIDDNTYDPASGNDPASGSLPIQQLYTEIELLLEYKTPEEDTFIFVWHDRNLEY